MPWKGPQGQGAEESPAIPMLSLLTALWIKIYIIFRIDLTTGLDWWICPFEITYLHKSGHKVSWGNLALTVNELQLSEPFSLVLLHVKCQGQKITQLPLEHVSVWRLPGAMTASFFFSESTCRWWVSGLDSVDKMPFRKYII